MSAAPPVRVLVADDDEGQRFVLRNALEAQGFAVDLAEDGAQALARLEAEPYPLAFIDIKMPGATGLEILGRLESLGRDTSVVIITAMNTMDHAIEAMGRGAFEYLTKPFTLERVADLARSALDARRRAAEAEKRERALEERADEPLVGRSDAMQAIYKTIGRLTQSDVTVLIQGESGTGKELIGRVIHQKSRRAKRPFVAVNAAAIPATLMESELFGFERGSFTGAHERHAGKFEQARGGTLFLDEIGEMPIDLQSKLLRVLQEGEFEPVGSSRPLKADVRIIAATNQDLEASVRDKRFRADLYYRLNVVTLKVPPLRERREDIELLARHFLKRFQRELGLGEKFLSEDALGLLSSWAWPGNVRELENLIKRAMALYPQKALSAADLSTLLTPAEAASAYSDKTFDELIRARMSQFLEHVDPGEPGNLHEVFLSRVEKPLLELVLAKAGGNQVRAAAMLGINRNTLRKKIHDLKIDVRAGKGH
jgi:two-component system nitrogen regulation response regulator GlnG